MGSRYPSYQLSNGLYVSGKPEQQKEKPLIMRSTAMPYTGGDIRKSGELGKMFEIHVENSRSKSGPINVSTGAGSFGANHSSLVSPGTGTSSRQKANSGPLNKHGEPLRKTSGPLSGGITPTGRRNSGPQPPILPTTGLITSGPLSSGPVNSATPRKSGPLSSVRTLSTAMSHNHAVTNLSEGDNRSQPNCWRRRAITRFIGKYCGTELRTAKDGQYIKVTGIVTCSNAPLESSFTKIPRCVYTSTRLYEYRGWGSEPVNSKHWHFTWGLRYLERHTVDFYISDFQSGLRALVKTGYGMRVTPYVDESVVAEIDPSNVNTSPVFQRWLAGRNLSTDNRVMRLKEGYIKEGGTVSVMGIVRRHQNVLMIVPPSSGTISTGCLWSSCLLPENLEGIVLRCEDTSDVDAVPV